jgi:hypothetical protein
MPSLEAVNLKELQQAFEEAPELTTRYVKGELSRFARRVRRKTIRERMSGRPGIEGGQFTRGKHVQGFATGSELATLKAVNKISRILRVHEEGAVITPRAAGWLYLSRKSGQAGQGRIFARVKSVTIPARLGFEALWRREVPDGQRRIADAMARAMRVSMERRMKAITSTIQRIVD